MNSQALTGSRRLNQSIEEANGCPMMNLRIRGGERHLTRQRQIVAELEQHGRTHLKTAQMGWDILASFEMAQSSGH
jgi:hypothetical protein